MGTETRSRSHFRVERALALAGGLLLGAGAAGAYPGGTPIQQTDVAPFCAGCHASRQPGSLAVFPEERARKELPATKHLALIRAGEEGYAELTPEQREELVGHIEALDAASTVKLEAPPVVAPGSTFDVTVRTTGGAGPVVAVALVDGVQRYHARPASAVGWQVQDVPEIRAGDGEPQTGWLAKRPEALGRNLTFVNVTDVESDAAAGEWAEATVTWTLRAPDRPGSYPLAAVYLYGTEKASPLGYTEDPLRGRQVRGGFLGHSGRVLFTPALEVRVVAEDAE